MGSISKKQFTIIPILVLMCFNVYSQRTVYDKNNNKRTYIKEDVNLTFGESKVVIPQQAPLKSAIITALIPAVIDLGFKIALNSIQNRLKKFTGEYSIQRSNLDAGKKNSDGNLTLPNIIFERKVQLEKEFEPALKLTLIAEKLADFNGYFYYVDSVELNYSKAKTTSNCKMFDYTIELKPTFLINNEKKTQDLYPISITSIDFNNKELEKYKYRTDIIILPDGSRLTEFSIKIVETNPDKVKTDKILEIFNAYKDDAKSIITIILKPD